MKEKFVTIGPGIRRKPDGTFLVTKSVKGERYYKTTETLPEAKKWKKNFIPITGSLALSQIDTPPTSFKLNGRNIEKTFGEVWKRYQKEHLIKSTEDSQIRIPRKVNLFAKSIMKMRMCEINEEVLLAVINERKILTTNPKRCNFKNEIKIMRCIFNWYKNSVDPFFESPVKDYHFIIGVIKTEAKKSRHIKPEQVHDMIEALPLFWKRFALFQFYMAGRVQEVAGLQWHFIDRDKRKLKVEQVMLWVNGRPQIKETTKTEVATHVYLNDHMLDMLDELEAERFPGCDLVFHKNGKPLRYYAILAAYNEALERIKSPFSGTHILRYGMAGYSGEYMGNEGSKAATRHGSMAMARKYRGPVDIVELTEENKQVVIHAENLFRKKA